MRSLLLATIALLAWMPVHSQTKIAMMTVTRSYCSGGTSTWNCTGMHLISIKLGDGTVLGPFVAIEATEEMISAPVWTAQETLECP